MATTSKTITGGLKGQFSLFCIVIQQQTLIAILLQFLVHFKLFVSFWKSAIFFKNISICNHMTQRNVAGEYIKIVSHMPRQSERNMHVIFV